MTKILLLTLALSILPILNSCGTKYSTTEMESYFTTSEIQDLKQITDFFIKSVCGKTSLEHCFKETNHDSLIMQETGIWEEIDFAAQNNLYQNISKTTFDKIWMYCETSTNSGKTKALKICAVPKGNYQKYLFDLGRTNASIANYADNILASGDFYGPDIRYHQILKANSDFDLNDKNIQLILAIHYLSLNDKAKRNYHLITH